MLKFTPLLLVFLLTTVFGAFSQTTGNEYPPDGVYATFSAFRNGKPDVIKSQLIKSTTETEYTFRQWVNSENLYYSDSAGQKQKYTPGAFWGYVEKGVLHLFLGNKFHKVHTLGQISYFLESYPTIKGTMAPVVTDSRASSEYRLLDMETGDILDYTVENLQDLLAPDETLHLEYKSIVSLKEKKKKMYTYLERFNNNHPLERQPL